MPSRSQLHMQQVVNVDASGRRRPFCTVLPTFSGTNTVGSLQTGVDGTWTGSATITITRRWSRNGVPIPGATGSTYTLVAGDSGKAIRFENIARNQYAGDQYAVSLPRTVP
jgi:hypothetical protein